MGSLVGAAVGFSVGATMGNAVVAGYLATAVATEVDPSHGAIIWSVFIGPAVFSALGHHVKSLAL